MTSQKSPQKSESILGGPALKFFALALLLLIGIGIYTLPPRLSGPWTSLQTPTFTSSSRQAVPQFEWVEGEKIFKTSDLRQKWFLISFWAYWCLPCLQELPPLQEMAINWNGPELEVITINVDDPKSENFELAKKFLVENNITLPAKFDTQGVLKKAFAVSELPRHFLVNPKGEIVWDARGAFDWSSAQVKNAMLKFLEPAPTPEGVESVE